MIYYRWENRDRQRYYKVILSQDLFSGWMMTKVWGSLNNASGRVVHVSCPSYEMAKSTIDKISKTRKQRGYTLCETPRKTAIK